VARRLHRPLRPNVVIWKTRLSRYGGHDTFPGKIEITENSVIVYAGDDRPVEILLAARTGKRPRRSRLLRLAPARS